MRKIVTSRYALSNDSRNRDGLRNRHETKSRDGYSRSKDGSRYSDDYSRHGYASRNKAFQADREDFLRSSEK